MDYETVEVLFANTEPNNDPRQQPQSDAQNTENLFSFLGIPVNSLSACCILFYRLVIIFCRLGLGVSALVAGIVDYDQCGAGLVFWVLLNGLYYIVLAISSSVTLKIFVEIAMHKRPRIPWMRYVYIARTVILVASLSAGTYFLFIAESCDSDFVPAAALALLLYGYIPCALIVLMVLVFGTLFLFLSAGTCCKKCLCREKGAGKGICAKLQAIPYSPEIHSHESVCPICIAEYLPGNRLITLPCHKLHYFHKQCIVDWLKINPICPICHSQI